MKILKSQQKHMNENAERYNKILQRRKKKKKKKKKKRKKNKKVPPDWEGHRSIFYR